MQNLEIIVGSQMGSAEYVAEQVQQVLVDQGIDVTLHLQPEYNELVHSTWLIVTSTYGAGDYPDNLLSFIERLNDTADLAAIQFAVIGIGDSSYDTFNFAAKNVEQLLLNKGATQLLPALYINVLDESLPEDTAEAWAPSLADVLNAS